MPTPNKRRITKPRSKPATWISNRFNTRRLTKRLRKYAEFIFTFLDYGDLAFDNDFAERQIRPAVIL